MSNYGNHERPGQGHSRRAFLKGSGAAAAATALAGGPGIAQADDAQPKVLEKGWNTLKLNVNGKDHTVQVQNRMTLLEVLRYQLGLTGAKPVSESGVAGAATVWLDGKPVSATTTLAVACQGKKIKTVESLAGKKLDPVPAAFVSQDAQQCGFCTPGFVVAVRAFMDKHPNATEQEIREGLNGNICRCGTYFDVIEAALEVAKGGGNG